MQTRMRKGTISRRRTCRSRSKRPAKARVYCTRDGRGARYWRLARDGSVDFDLGFQLAERLLAQVAACEPDEDGFQAGFGHGEVAQAVGVAGADDLGEQAVGVVGEDADAVRRGLRRRGRLATACRSVPSGGARVRVAAGRGRRSFCAPTEPLSAAGVSSTRILPWSMMATRSQSSSASSM